MTLDTQTGKWRLAPDAAPGSPYLNNIIPFPEPEETNMARCFADTADLITEEELQQTEAALLRTPDCDAKTLITKLIFTVKTLRRELSLMTDERDNALAASDSPTPTL